MQIGSRVAVALIGPLAWQPPCVVGAALEKAKRQKKKKSYVSGLQNFSSASLLASYLTFHQLESVFESRAEEEINWLLLQFVDV